MEQEIYKLGRIQVFTDLGEQVELHHYWDKQPAVLIFVRHFG